MKKSLTLSLTLTLGTMMLSAAEVSPYISKVYDYLPAPGQFVNEMPEYIAGDTHDDIIVKVEEQICGEKNPGMISLGAYGGYVVFGFDHPVVNVADAYDFKIYGNAFAANNAASGGSCEPGIVMVSVDENGDGMPNDTWYELAGSEYSKETTKKNYKITYYRSAADKEADPDPDYKFITDRTYIRYTTNYDDEAEGYVMRNSFHAQSYWPEWIDAETLEFEGTKLADNYIDQSGNGSYYVLQFLDWGYADNLPNESYDGFKIDWAVDADGNPVELKQIDFIKVYTAVNKYCGWIGETSTEVCGAEDFHPEAEASGIGTIVGDLDNVVLLAHNSTVMMLRNGGEPTEAVIFSINGGMAKAVTLEAGDNAVDISMLSQGVYLLRTPSKTIKFVK